MARIIWRSSPGVFIWCISRKHKLALALHINRALTGVHHKQYPTHWPWWKRFALHFCRPHGAVGDGPPPWKYGPIPGMYRMWVYRRGRWGKDFDFVIDRRGVV
jgi:hypothetical protein